MIKQIEYSIFMNEATQKSWFYTRAGEQAGPVDFAVLRTKAREGGLNPRQDMVWSQGMDEWKPAGDIEGLFEKRTVEEAPAPPPAVSPPAAPQAADPYSPPAHSSDELAAISPEDWPGARRRSYLFMVLLFPFLWMLVLAFVGTLMGQGAGSEAMALVAAGGTLVPVITGIAYGLMRLTNLGMSRWWFLGNFVPFLNLWVAYRCFACPAGYAYHKKMDGVGIFLAIVYWLLLILALIGLIVTVAVMAGELGTPEMRQQILEALAEGAEAPANP